MFRTVPLSIIRSFSLYTQQWYMSHSLRTGSGRKPTRCTNFGIKFYMFRKIPLSVISIPALYTTGMVYVIQLASRIRTELKFCPDPARKLSANLYDIYHSCVYSAGLLVTDTGIFRNMQNFIPKLVHLVGFRPVPASKLSTNLYDMYNFCVYSENLLMMDR